MTPNPGLQENETNCFLRAEQETCFCSPTKTHKNSFIMAKKGNLKDSDIGPQQLYSFVRQQKANGVLKGALPKPTRVFDNSDMSKFWLDTKKDRRTAMTSFNHWYKKAIDKEYKDWHSKSFSAFIYVQMCELRVFLTFLIRLLKDHAADAGTPTVILKPHVSFTPAGAGDHRPASFFTPPMTGASNYFPPPAAGLFGGAGDNRIPSSAIPATYHATHHQKNKKKNKRAKDTKVEIDVRKTDFDSFFIAPKAMKIGNDTIVPMIVILPFPVSNPKDILIVNNGKKATITFNTPKILLQPKRMMPNDAKKNGSNNKHGLCYNACINHRESLVEKKDDPVTFDIVLDLPFTCEPKLASEQILGVEGNPVFKTYCGPSFFDVETFEQLVDPSHYLHTLVLLFKKVDTGFKVSTEVNIDNDIIDDDDDGDDLSW